MTKHDHISRIDDRFATLSYDELMLLVERGRKMRSRAMHDYMVGIGGLLRRSLQRSDAKQAPANHGGRPLSAKHA